MVSDKKRKWWEGGILLLVLLLTAGLMWIGLSGRKRTSHIYAYDESVNIRKEQKLADNGSGGEQTDSRQKETPPPDPEKQQEQPQTPPDPDIPDDTSSDREPVQKKQEKKTDGADDADDVNDKDPEDPEEPDQGGEPDGDQSNTSGENDNGSGDNGDNGNAGDNGNGGENGNGPGGTGPEKPAPTGTMLPIKTALPVVASTGTPRPVRPVPSIPAVPKPTPIPIPTSEPTEVPTQEPTATPEPDKPVSLACTWKDKDSLIYGDTIPKDSISVKVTMSSGREITLSPSEYTIAGLKNDALGEHIMTIVYENVSCKIRYTVNNAIDHLEIDWPTKDKCYKGEIIEDADITVTVYMVDDTYYDLEDGQYMIQGIDNQKMDVQQSFTITYKDQKIEGTCTFHDRVKTYTDSYYDDSTLDETKTWSESVAPDEEISGITGEIVEHNGKQYELTAISVTADGKKKNFSDNAYIIGRVFDIQITRRYELIE